MERVNAEQEAAVAIMLKKLSVLWKSRSAVNQEQLDYSKEWRCWLAALASPCRWL